MELIADLEDSPRGVYCGAVGFLAPGPSLSGRFNVAIRTVVLDAETRTAEYGVGGGITWGSSAAREYDEAIAKARVLVARRPRFDLVETLRHDPEEGYARLDLHLERLRASAEHFGFGFDEHEIRSALAREVAGSAKPLRVRLLVDRRGRPIVSSAPVVRPAGPVRLALALDEPVDPSDPMLFHKTSLRERYERARSRHPEADDVVLVNTRGEITETTVANVCVQIDGRWWTPPRDAGLLPGVEREAMLADRTIAERTLLPVDLTGSNPIAVINSVRGWREAELAQSPLAAGRSSGNS
jgi:para-aminobenzoate synthetase/4-amino-4-deoxychorismate lyase